MSITEFIFLVSLVLVCAFLLFLFRKQLFSSDNTVSEELKERLIQYRQYRLQVLIEWFLGNLDPKCLREDLREMKQEEIVRLLSNQLFEKLNCL